MIEKYNFGSIIVRGKRYSSDVIIYPERVNDAWWRNRGLELFIGPTPRAVKEYNRKHREKRTVAALHLTC